jgi:putative acetyltransferase
MEFRLGMLDDPRVKALLDHHIRTARAATEPGSAHALDHTVLAAADIRFWTAWSGETLLGVGAWKRLDAGHGEVKSMHTAQAARGKGVASAMVGQIVADAAAHGIARLSLETGSWDYFKPARALYRKHGFVDCAPFGDYVPDRNSTFMSREIAPSR